MWSGGIYALLCVLAADRLLLALADTALFCVHNEDERSECNRLRSIPPLDPQCAKEAPAAQCLQFNCVLAAGSTPQRSDEAVRKPGSNGCGLQARVTVLQDCRVEIRERNADIMMASALGLWYLEQDFAGVYAPIAAEHRNATRNEQKEDGFTYKAVAVATREKCEEMATAEEGPLTLFNSRGLRSCHGEYGDLAGWVTPIARLREAGLMAEGGSDIDKVTNWFTRSCAPSNSDTGICSACSSEAECDLDDPYATSTGVIQCLRDGAADIGFIDNWTAWGAGQQETDDGGVANFNDLQVVCNSGCRDMRYAAEADCYEAKVPADVAIMRATDPRIEIVRNSLVEASQSIQFQDSFSKSGNLKGALFSHGTSRLGPVVSSTQDYLAGLDTALTQFANLFQDSTDIPQPDVGENRLLREVKAHPGWAVGITFLGALLLGMLAGLGLTTFICRRRKRAAMFRSSYHQDIMEIPQAAFSTRGAGTSRVEHPTYVEES